MEYTEPIWRGLNMRSLKVDEAYIILKNFYAKATYLYTLSDECYTCPYTKVKVLQPSPISNSEEELTKKFETLTVNVAHALKFKLFDKDVGRYAFDNETALCDFYRSDMREFGVYNLTLESNATCSFVTDKQGVNAELSILTVFLLWALIFLVIKVCICAYNYFYCDDGRRISLGGETSGETEESAGTAQRKRMRCLDAFRGMAIVLMIFVNSGGGEYWWIEHAPWNGLHLADIVFPSFLWIMGVCIPISVKSQLGRGATKWQICRRIAWRSFKLFAIGLCLNSINGPNLEELRIMGVLQRFGIAFLICGVLHTIFSKREQTVSHIPWKRSMRDLILFKGEFLVMLALIVIHLSIVFGLNVPDCPRGYLGPGGKHANASYPNCIGGATGFIDLKVLGNSHIYQHPTAKYIYDSKAFDPEGVFGCLLTIVQVLFGVLAGVIILTHEFWRSRIYRWLGWSVALGLIGGILCTFSKEGGPIPLNKNLWSLSFVFVTAALAFAMLSILYVVIDVWGVWHGFPFVQSGMNAIIMYVGHTVMHKMLPWHWRLGAMNTHFVLLLEATWNTLLWIGIALYLNAKKFYYSL